MIPRCPFAHEVGIGDDDARGHLVGRKYGDRLAGLDEQCVFGAEALEFMDDGMEALPVARGTADAAVYDEVLGALSDFGIEVVHEAAEGGFLLPAFAAEGVAARGTNDRRRGRCGSHDELLRDGHFEDTTGKIWRGGIALPFSAEPTIVFGYNGRTRKRLRIA